MCWKTFSHVFCISSAEFFYPYVNIDFPRYLDSTDFDFSLLEVLCCNMPACIPLPLIEILPFTYPTPLPELPLPLPMVVYCRWWYQPYFFLGEISLNLKCWWYSLLRLGTLRNILIFVVVPLYPSSCNCQTGFSKSYQEINDFTGSPVVLISVNKRFFDSSSGFLIILVTVIWRSWRFYRILHACYWRAVPVPWYLYRFFRLLVLVLCVSCRFFGFLGVYVITRSCVRRDRFLLLNSRYLRCIWSV